MSRLSVNPVESIIENSIEIYKYEIGDLKKKGNNYVGLCPLHGENTPSFNVNSNHPHLFKCFGCSQTGNVISFVSKLYNISYSKAIEHILSLNIHTNKSVEHKKAKESKPLVVDWIEMPKMTKKALEYWNSYELSEDFLKQNNVFQAKTIAFNKKIKKYPEDALIFIYWAKNIDKIKILNLTPGTTKEDKWRNFTPNDYLWFYDDFVNKPCDKLFLSKSVKDSLVLKAVGRCSISVQNESAKIQIDNNIEKINKIGKEVYVVYGSDSQGKKESKLLTQATGWKHFNTKDKYLKMYDCNDPAELVRVFSLKKLDSELKIKGL